MLVLAAVTLGSQVVDAATLYSNGPISGEIGAFDITNYKVSNSFVLTQASIITGVSFGNNNYAGNSIQSVDWGITTGSNLYPAAGTAGVSIGTSFINSFGIVISEATFSIPSLALPAGTYYLVLQNARTDTGAATYWDDNNGPSSASAQGYGDLAPYYPNGGTNSEAFSILGEVAFGTSVSLDGGGFADPAALPAGLIGGIDGAIGPDAPEQFYTFSWNGGAFGATASIIDAAFDDTFKLVLSGVGYKETSLLDAANGFVGSLAVSDLAAGTYTIGLSADLDVDPRFSIRFTSPIGAAVPEPASWALMIAGVGVAGGALRRRRSAKTTVSFA
jgi:hypothetical protein